MARTSIRITGSSGSGLVSTGEIFMRALKHMGFYLTSDREYPSLIKGGFATLQIDFDTAPLRSLSRQVSLVVAVDRVGYLGALNEVMDGGTIIHGDERYELVPDLIEQAKARNIRLIYLPEREIVHAVGGNLLMTNMVILGVAWRVLGWELAPLVAEMEKRFKSKPALLALDLKCLAAGYAAEGVENLPNLQIPIPASVPNTILLEGNQSLALGAIHGGMRAYYAYPMSPSSSILTYIAATAKQTGVLVKQAEDEITAAQMAIGSMHMGTRALVATSGGGYDLMTETISLAGIIETPLVIALCQRPGPGTGLPTRTAQGDLNLAIHAGHGEFARVVIGVSDPESCFELTQHALNLAEQFQTFVALLTEKVICETHATVPPFEQNKIPVLRGLVEESERLGLVSADRYALSASGVSKRWLPGQSETVYYANSDEHLEDGRLTEAPYASKAMMDKRIRKHNTIHDALPDPTILGPKKGAAISFVGWGSSKNVMHDIIAAAKDSGVKVNYLHFDYLWPLRTDVLNRFFQENSHVFLIEGNAFGQLGILIEQHTENRFVDRLLKYDGQAFFVEDVLEFIQAKTKQSLKFK